MAHGEKNYGPSVNCDLSGSQRSSGAQLGSEIHRDRSIDRLLR